MRRSSILPLLFAGMLIACGGDPDPVGSRGSDADTDTDSDSDTDTDTDTDSDSDSDSDSDTNGQSGVHTGSDAVDCDGDYTGNMTPVPDGECVAQSIECGDTIYGTTEDGTDAYTLATYSSLMCMGRWTDTDYNGPERSFSYHLPPNTNARFTFQACTETKVTVLNNASTSCPATGGTCNSRPMLAQDWWDFSFNDTAFQNPINGTLVIEARNELPTNFKVTMECSPR